MRNKTANELLKTLKYLTSPDKELMNLGVGLFLDCYLLKQLNKYKKFELDYKWPGFSSNKPEHFVNVPRYGKILKFTKGQFIKMLNSKAVPVDKKACLILCLVYDLASEGRNKNFMLKSCISSNSLSNKIVEYYQQLNGKRYYKQYLLDKENKLLTESRINFEEELRELNLNIDFRKCSPRDVISTNKLELSSKYKSKVRKKWFLKHKNEIATKYKISFKDFELFERSGYCSKTFYDLVTIEHLL